MSNRVSLSSKMRDKHVLSEALNQLGIKHEVCEEDAVIVDYWSKEVTNKASIKVSKYVGFEADSEGKLRMVGDTHYENGLLAKPKAIDKVEQVYKAVNVYNTLQNAGYNAEADFSNCATAEEIHVVAEVNFQ